ncbi:MAG: DUF4258 domain-containing protein [Candidatus Protochlamydia sp.]|nr:DUF4258 domain-containing protein [Candidatus Protochlamydia sp.]
MPIHVSLICPAGYNRPKGSEFSYNFCTGKLKLTVISSSSQGDSKKLANQTNCFLPPPGGNCTFPPGVPPPLCVVVPLGMVASTGQSTVKVDGQPALGEDCKFMCPLFAQPVTLSKSDQAVAKHDEASTTAQVASLAADFISFVGSGKSIYELFSGSDPITGEAVNRWMSAAGIFLGVVTGGKALIKGKKAAKLAKKALKKSATKGTSKKGLKAANDNVKGKKAIQAANDNIPASAPDGSKTSPQINAPFQKTRNSPAVHQNRNYSGHALDQMQNRGIPPSVVEDTIKTGTPKSYIRPDGATTNFYDKVNNITVVVNDNNGVIIVSHGKLGK